MASSNRFALLLLFPLFGSPLLAIGDDAVEFNRDIRPILSSNCFDCHGIDGKHRKAELRLDTLEGATADHNGAVAIKPGDLDGSELWNRVTSDDPEVVMPPPSTKKTLTAAQKDLLKRWIEQGAKYQKHWAFEKPASSEKLPAVANANWVKNPVDAFPIIRTSSIQTLPPF